MDSLFYVNLGLLLLLLVIVAVLLIRIFQYKKQMRLFAEKLENRIHEDVNQDISVEYFDKDILALANALNDYSNEIKQKNIDIANEEAKLKGVIAGISHDFRTPLTSAKGYLQLLKKDMAGKMDENNQEHLDLALAKIDYLKALSDGFFEVSSMEAKDQEVEISDIDVGRILTEIALEQYDWISEKGINAEFNIPEASCMVKGNDALTKRIFYNLFSNMRKYAGENIKVELQFSEGNVKIIFANDICEDSEVDSSKVFDAFYRGTSRNKEGVGLGLYVVRQLAEKMNYQTFAKVENHQFVVWILI